MKCQGGKEDCEEVGAGLDDGARHGAGAREAQIEKEVLTDGLKERQDKDGLDIACLWDERAALGCTHTGDNQDTGKCEAQTCKE